LILWCDVSYGKETEINHLEDPRVDLRIILKWTFKKWDGRYGLDWSGSGYGHVKGSSECGDDLWVPLNAGGSLLAEDLLASQEGLYSMESVSINGRSDKRVQLHSLFVHL
jgi:hypothetical protein